MNCPEHIVVDTRHLKIWMYYRDVPRKTIPLSVWLNPLRYEVTVRAQKKRWFINPEGIWNFQVNRLISNIKNNLLST